MHDVSFSLGIMIDGEFQEIEYEGVSVIIPRRECLHTTAKKIKAEKKKKELEKVKF